MQSEQYFEELKDVREDIIGELQVCIQYEEHMMNADDELTRSVYKDILDEEELHVGQLFGLYFQKKPEAKELFDKGMQEFLQDNSMEQSEEGLNGEEQLNTDSEQSVEDIPTEE